MFKLLGSFCLRMPVCLPAALPVEFLPTCQPTFCQIACRFPAKLPADFLPACLQISCRLACRFPADFPANFLPTSWRFPADFPTNFLPTSCRFPADLPADFLPASCLIASDILKILCRHPARYHPADLHAFVALGAAVIRSAASIALASRGHQSGPGGTPGPENRPKLVL